MLGIIDTKKFTKEILMEVINTEELVNRFGTDKNKERYNIVRKLTNCTKEAILSRANIKYNIEDLGNGKYAIHNEREIELPYSFYKLNNGLYKYLAPLILNKILYDYHEKNKHATTLLLLANNIESSIISIN